jgi:SAM-dependent methyltransferase
LTKDNHQNTGRATAETVLKAIEYDIDNPVHWRALSRLAATGVNLPVEEISDLVVKALKRKSLQSTILSQFVFALLQFKIVISNLKKMPMLSDLDKFLESEEATYLFEDDLLLAILPNIILHEPSFEELFTQIRKALLNVFLRRSLRSEHMEPALQFTSALACYCFATEFVFYISEQEEENLPNARQLIRDGPLNDGYDRLMLAIVGCYESLSRVSGAAAITNQREIGNSSSAWREMTHLQIDQCNAENSHLSGVKAFCSVEDDVSRAVQQQYSENPYPRWMALQFSEPGTINSRMREKLPYLADDQYPVLERGPDKPLSVLIAGCGTGREALLAAREYRDVDVFAVDLSAPSLAYATMKAEEYDVRNVTFRQGDLINLPVLNRKFDVIESVGVLHHLASPMAGLEALDKCLKPGGWMKIALYSYAGRKAIRRARQAIDEMQIDASPAGIRAFRKYVMQNPEHELYQVCAKWRDFYSLSECRDLLFHVQEHQLTIDEIKELIGPLELEFVGFQIHVGQLPGDGSDAPDPRSLDQWSDFEQQHPDTFGSMYVMWLRKPAA